MKHRLIPMMEGILSSVRSVSSAKSAAALLLFLVNGSALFAQEAAPSGPTSSDELALIQSSIADKYVKLEQLMLKMAELEGLTNPKRAQLLTRAVEQSK